MSFFGNVGPLTWIAPGETQYWQYGWGPAGEPGGGGPIPDPGLCISGPNLADSGSSDAELVAFDQGKALMDPYQPYYVYYVAIKNAGSAACHYNLQVGGFK